MLKKSKIVVACVATLALSGAVLAGCSSAPAASSASSQASSASAQASSSAATETLEIKEVTMQKCTPADTQDAIGNDNVIILDVRKAADYEAGHIPGAVNADMDAAKDGDNETGVANMKAAMQKATGTDNGGDKDIILVCYSGNRYAQAATNILAALGANMDNVLTMEGGMKAWTGDIEK